MDLAPLDLLASLLGLALCAVIVGIAEPAINRIRTHSAPFLARLALALLVVWAVAGILEILGGHIPGPFELLLAGTLAVGLWLARRARLISRLYDHDPTKGSRHAQG